MIMTKNIRPISAMIIFLFFVFTANDCGAVEGAAKQKRNLQIEQLGLQRKILQAIDLYEEFSKTSVERVKGLNKLLGDTSYSEAVELFQSGKTPHELIPAQSEWMKLVAHEQYRWLLRIWLDNRAKENQLVQFELKIEDIDARIKIGGVLTEQDQEEINRLRLLVTEINIPDARRVSQVEQRESANRANEWLEKAMSNINKGGTE